MNMSDEAVDTFLDGEGEEGSLMMDLSDVEAMSFDAIPKGLYPVVVDSAEYQISKASSQPMWAMTFTITEGEYENRKLFSYFSFSEKAKGMTKTNLAALAPELLEGPFDIKKIADEGYLAGKTALAKVAVEKGQDNEDRNAIKVLKPLSGDTAEGDGFEV